MASSDNSKGSAKSFAPGTFDRTRKNIGPLAPDEAAAMVQKLGGEILPERDVPMDPKKLPIKKKADRPKATGMTASEAQARAGSYSSSSSSSSKATGAKAVQDLPNVNSKDLKLMNKLMMSEEYEIKPDYGVFNFLFNSKDKLSKKFCKYTLKRHAEHFDAFVTLVRSLVQMAPDSYSALISTETDIKFKILRAVSKWNPQELKSMASDMTNKNSDITIPMLIPFVRSAYRQILTVYFIGEQGVSLLIKETFEDISSLQKADKKKVQTIAKQAITEWVYIYEQIAKGLYPLLMRMSSTVYVEYPKFFTQQINQILQFVGLSAYDIIRPEKRKKVKIEDEAEEKKEDKNEAGKKDEVVETGLKLLEQLFPKAGFLDLESHPDMYPYFDPIYKFQEGFNMLSAENPLQVTIVLLKILDDLFHGCRNIDFNIQGDEELAQIPDTINAVIGDWSYYIDELFFKVYCEDLKSFMNSLYTQDDYATTQYGKETINNILWSTKLYFLPHFKFNAPTLTHPRNMSNCKPLYARTEYIRAVFTKLGRRIDDAAIGRRPVLGVTNPWERYKFDIPNALSKRMDVLLGAKKDNNSTGAHNANLIKYTMCIMAVLDWWINNSSSPAYTGNPDKFYRSSDDGRPEFSTDMRTDQNQLFADAVKKAASAAKAAKN